MAEVKKMTFEALCLAMALNEEQIINLRLAQKDIMQEIRNRKNTMLDKFRKGELPLEYSAELMITKEGEEDVI